MPKDYADLYYRKKQAELTALAWKRGIFDFKRKPKLVKVCSYNNCNNSYLVLHSDPKRFCSKSCSAKYNNANRDIKRTGSGKMSKCINCQKTTRNLHSKYCSNKCQAENGYHNFIENWKSGTENGVIGISTKTLSGHIRRYMKEKHGTKCYRCGWDQMHPITGHIPLEINHIDGNAENNKEENLELLCPNCHSLTPNFRNLNKGKGRKWRLEYIKTH